MLRTGLLWRAKMAWRPKRAAALAEQGSDDSALAPGLMQHAARVHVRHSEKFRLHLSEHAWWLLFPLSFAVCTLSLMTLLLLVLLLWMLVSLAAQLRRGSIWPRLLVMLSRAAETRKIAS